MKVWDDKNSAIGFWALCVDGQEVLGLHDVGNFYKAWATLGGRDISTAFAKIPLENVQKDAENWYVEKANEHILSLETAVQQCKNVLKALEEPQYEKLVDIFDLEFDSEGYLHFHVLADGYALEGLYRLYAPANGPDMTLVSIDYGYLHPIIERQWSRIDEALYDISLSRYHDILDKSEAFKEKVIAAMEAAGYTYDVLESHEGWESFYGEGGARLGFDRLREAAEWLDGVVFDDHEVGRKVEEIMHPERQEPLVSIDSVIENASVRCPVDAICEAKVHENVKD